MTSLARKTLSAFIGATMVATPLNACAAEDSATSEANTATANESTQTSSAIEPLKVQYIPADDLSLDGASFVAANASRDKVAIVVWGGNHTIQAEAYKAALDLIDMGIPTAFVLAPDHNNLDGDAVMQVYASSMPRSDAHWGLNNADKVREDMRNAGLAAYKEAFPQQIATLSIR